jgi:exodeoxyribonuclease VII small subunit
MAADKPRGAPPTAAGKEAAPPSFEAAIERLETIVDELESGTLTLEESIARYEEGMKLSKQLTRTLDEAEKRIERLAPGAGADETPRTEPTDLDLKSPETPSEGKLPF